MGDRGGDTRGSTPSKATPEKSSQLEKASPPKGDVKATPAKKGAAPAAAAAAAAAAATPSPKKKQSDVVRRTVTTLVMVGIFAAIIYFRHPAVYLAVLLVQLQSYREIMRVLNLSATTDPTLADSPWLSFEELIPKQTCGTKGLKLRRAVSVCLPWYWCVVSVLYFYSGALRRAVIAWEPEAEDWVWWQRYPLVCYSLYIAGFCAFVLTLRPKKMGLQFAQFAWVHLCLVFLMVLGCCFVYNVNIAFVWLVVPVSCININDTFAYIFGRLFGRTPLIAISPKKTLEGFIGAAIATVVWSLLFTAAFVRWPSNTCTVEALATGECSALPTPFVPTPRAWLGGVEVAPAVLHAVPVALFASFVAPFGGFFASGVKRVFGVKDFGTLIPGHGGMVDRMDCQLLVGLFVWLWVTNFVSPEGGVCASLRLLKHCVARMGVDDQVALARHLTARLAAKGMWP